MVGAGGGTPPAPGVWGSAVSSHIGMWGGAPEALQLYYIPIMKRVKKKLFSPVGFCAV